MVRNKDLLLLLLITTNKKKQHEENYLLNILTVRECEQYIFGNKLFY